MDFTTIMHRLDRLRGRGAMAVLAALLLAGCSGGVKGVDKPFPDLANAPPKPEPATTKEERDALRADMTARREQMQNTAQALLRGGTEAVSVMSAPSAPSAPPPQPDNLPSLPEHKAPAKDTADAGRKGSVAAPDAGDLPEAVAAEEIEENGDGSVEDELENEKDEDEDG